MNPNASVRTKRIAVRSAWLAALLLTESLFAADSGVTPPSVPTLTLPERFGQALEQAAAAGTAVDISSALTGVNGLASGSINHVQGDVSLSNTPQALQQDQLTQVIASSQMSASVVNNSTTIGVADSGYRATNTLGAAFASHQGAVTVSQSAGISNTISQAITFQVGLDLNAPSPSAQ